VTKEEIRKRVQAMWNSYHNVCDDDVHIKIDLLDVITKFGQEMFRAGRNESSKINSQFLPPACEACGLISCLGDCGCDL